MPDHILLLSHTEKTRRFLTNGAGEIAHAEKFERLLQESGFSTEITDIFDLFGGVKKTYEPLALLNDSLAEMGENPIEESRLKSLARIQKKLTSSDFLVLLSWGWSLGALLATGIQKKIPLISKLYAFHENEKVKEPLYRSSAMILTESPLAIERGKAYGIPREKLLFMPHSYPKETQFAVKDPSFFAHLENANGKPFPKDAIVIGMVSRLDYRKNCEYALLVGRELVKRGHHIAVVIKGDFAKGRADLTYKKWLKQRIKAFKKESWFFHDDTSAPLKTLFSQMQHFDIVLHLSGAESASNIVVESLALGKPTVILDASTNPSLFRGGAVFVKKAELKEGQLPFYVPDESDLIEKVGGLVSDQSSRRLWGDLAIKTAKERFSPERTLERIPLLFKMAQCPSKKLTEELLALHEEDRKRYEH